MVSQCHGGDLLLAVVRVMEMVMVNCGHVHDDGDRAYSKRSAG